MFRQSYVLYWVVSLRRPTIYHHKLNQKVISFNSLFYFNVRIVTKCRLRIGWNFFLSLGQHYGGFQWRNITPCMYMYMHITTCHVPEMMERLGSIKPFSAQGTNSNFVCKIFTFTTCKSSRTPSMYMYTCVSIYTHTHTHTHTHTQYTCTCTQVLTALTKRYYNNYLTLIFSLYVKVSRITMMMQSAVTFQATDMMLPMRYWWQKQGLRSWGEILLTEKVVCERRESALSLTPGTGQKTIKTSCKRPPKDLWHVL